MAILSLSYGYLPITLTIIFIFIFLRKQKHAAVPQLSRQDGLTSLPRSVSSTIPIFGHLISYAKEGPRYFNKLSISTNLPVFRVKIASAKICLIQREAARFLPRMKHVSSNPLVYEMLRQCLGLGRFSCTLLQEKDVMSRRFGPHLSKMFREEFIPNLRLRDYIQQMNHYIELEISKIPEQEVDVGDWVFRCLLGALGKTIWGGENGPFHDQEFLSHLRPFLLNLRALNNPATYLIDKQLLESRRIVRDRLEKFTFEEYTEKCNGSQADGQKEGGFLGRIRSLCIRQGAPPEGWTDYQLLLIAGIGPNIVAASTWLIYHLLADKDRLTKVRNEIDRIVTDHQGAVDLADVPEACPLLYATWIEVLRFHGTFTLGRYVHEDTTLADTYLFQKGSYALAPLQQHHFEPEVWGDDVNEFRPERFIKCGKFDYETRKKVRVFGLFGTICPGRFLAANVALSLTIRLLSTFDVVVPGGDFILPEERKDSVVGLSPPERDIIVGLSRRPLDYDINLTWKS